MHIRDAMEAAQRPFLSFEFFPPADEEALKDFYTTVERLLPLNPLFASVTYGAGGSKQDRTLAIARHLASEGLNVMSHLTCVNAVPAGLLLYLERLHEAGVDNVLALRGDPPKGITWTWDGPFRHAVDLVRYIRRQMPEMGVGVAGYPCPHPESMSYEEDRRFTKEKLDAGADFVVTQLFFDAREYFELVNWLEEHGCHKKVIPGILPIQSFASVRRVLSMCGASIPAKLYLELEEADRLGGEAEVRRVGVEFAVEQITRLLVGGAPGIHLYTLNKADLCLDIARAAGLGH